MVDLLADGEHRGCDRPFCYPNDGTVIRNNAGRLGPGVDIRGEAGYVIVPPSVHVSGKAYEWVPSRSPFDLSPAPLPPWLIRLIQPSSASSTVQGTDYQGIPKGRRNSILTSLAGTMRKRAMSKEAIAAALDAENAVRCEEALSDQEIQQIVDSVCRYSPGSSGHGSSQIQTITAEELAAMTFPEKREVVPDLLPEGVTILASRPKTGKSWLGLSLACEVAKGGEVFGKIQVPQSEALYIGLEDTPERLKGRLEIMTDDHPKGLHLVTQLRRLDLGGITDLDEWLKAHPLCRLVVLDTFGRVRSEAKRGANVYQADIAAVALLQQVAQHHQIALLVIHHVNKQYKVEDILDTVSGTQGIAGTADAVWILTRPRHSDQGKLMVTGRDLPERELDLHFHADGGFWELLSSASSGTMSPERQAVLDTLKAAGSPMQPHQLAKAMGRTSETVRPLLRKLYRDGLVDRTSQAEYFVHPHHTNHSDHTGTGDHTDHGVAPGV